MWVNRQLLLLGANRLSAQQRERLIAILNTADPSGDLRAAWQVKEQLRMLLAEHQPSRIRGRLADFYEAAVDPGIPETIRLAKTIQAWWPAILVALTENVTNARSEGFNRIIKQTKCVGCGYRNMINYQRRILTHIAVTRPRRPAA
jgi:transposase